MDDKHCDDVQRRGYLSVMVTYLKPIQQVVHRRKMRADSFG